MNQRRGIKPPKASGHPGDKPAASLEEYKEKVMNVCKAFDKIPGDKVRRLCVVPKTSM